MDRLKTVFVIIVVLSIILLYLVSNDTSLPDHVRYGPWFTMLLAVYGMSDDKTLGGWLGGKFPYDVPIAFKSGPESVRKLINKIDSQLNAKNASAINKFFEDIGWFEHHSQEFMEYYKIDEEEFKKLVLEFSPQTGPKKGYFYDKLFRPVVNISKYIVINNLREKEQDTFKKERYKNLLNDMLKSLDQSPGMSRKFSRFEGDPNAFQHINHIE